MWYPNIMQTLRYLRSDPFHAVVIQGNAPGFIFKTVCCISLKGSRRRAFTIHAVHTKDCDTLDYFRQAGVPRGVNDEGNSWMVDLVTMTVHMDGRTTLIQIDLSHNPGGYHGHTMSSDSPKLHRGRVYFKLMLTIAF
ncbi:hypothetical protein A0H81_10844 [Grifola frondosa]|uniref:Uncharacterized protein n=1 Tax=Grifola frondosa TaxID=5627 RepID=A0A1C7LZ20_GRIFR|nr:hypothetical protein A0H81_10844 [Grifola frondosa]